MAGSNGRADQAEMAETFGRQPIDQRPAGARRHQAAQAGDKFRLDHGVELAPAAAKVAWSLGGSCSERAGATIGWPDSNAGVSSLCAASGWRGGSTTTQRI